MYNLIFLHVYIRECAHPQKFRFRLSPCRWPSFTHFALLLLLLLQESQLCFPVATCLFLCALVIYFIFMLFIFHMRVKVYSTCHSPPDLFHLAEYPEGPSVLSQMAVFHLFWWKQWLCSILLYIYIIYIYWSGNPLQYPCLENPRDRRAWWAAVYGVAQSRTRLKWLSSSSILLDVEFL